MGQEYRDWLQKHPEATEEEKEEAWNKFMTMLEARNLVFEMLLMYRY